jgi:hypothetical protein
MLPSTLSNFMPSSLVELILDLISIKASMDVADSRAFVVSDAIALVWAIPKAVKTKAK